MARDRSAHSKDWLAQYSQLLGAWRRKQVRREDAEDAMQDTMASLLENGVGAIEEPRAYLQRSVYNRMVSMHRAHTVRAALPLHELPDEKHPAAASAEESCAARQLADAMVQALSELPLACQEVFKLHRLEGWPHERIAAHLGVSRNMIERHMMRAMRHLQDKLHNHGL
ncbi:sigma-70 family RNA polymerase sigma factor [Bordetella sp. BOR01]|uniref:sigma-70 family RNA polymerase sigma factor n=1 Tax=Bordetella sp. BOR01 TaxID=2854779 RepID=UPI001C459839|nr:sigma-70 family RNA polymerase sigma factor [Bordetella sp. BOR01]MBV7486415.1 sigma-70 family RNA polymerase sigma factor [Bordetella sp. BOR01]